MLLLLPVVLATAVDPEVTAVGMVATVTMVTAMDTTGTAATGMATVAVGLTSPCAAT
jgi:hypothetical protein